MGSSDFKPEQQALQEVQRGYGDPLELEDPAVLADFYELDKE